MAIYHLALAALTFSALTAGQTTIGGLSGSHTDIPRWCGKPYMAGSPNFPPGGMLHPPQPSPSPMLDLLVRPRHSIYDSSEQSGEFIVDAALSYIHGQQYNNASSSYEWHREAQSFEALDFTIQLDGKDQALVSSSVTINTTDNIYTFHFNGLEPRLAPYSISLSTGSRHHHSVVYTAKTELYYLPSKNTGSTVKIDNLAGGMLVANNATNYAFEPLLPLGFYTSCSGYLNYSLANVTAYKDFGFNAINPVCAFTDGDLGYLFDWMDETNLWYQYDMRGSYLNLTQVAEQIPQVKDRSNLLSWYTADEPDGWQYALNSTRLAYDLLKRQDPYHPTGLVLNCDNYYYDEYASGADYIMEDAYPVGINPTYSRPWNTTCNKTYGDCGCDDCIGSLTDVSMRLDTLAEYQEWLGEPEKPLWAVLQAFSGEGYWARDPKPQETWVMMLLSFNHGAKGIMSWTFPASETLEEAHGAMAKVATVPPVSTFLLGAQPKRVEVGGNMDVAYWRLHEQVMIGIANLDNGTGNGTFTINVPCGVSRIVSQPWGSLELETKDDSLFVSALSGLDTSFVILGT